MNLSFDGTDYYGWQKQPDKKTVQSVLSRVVSELVNQEVMVIGCSRTDSGVHADSYYCHFDVDSLPVSDEKALFVINSWLPLSIRLHSLKPVSDSFHAQKSAFSKTYMYRFSFYKDRSTRNYRFVHYLKGTQHDLTLIYNYLPALIGTYDFTSFCSESDRYLSRVRTIHSLAFFHLGTEYRIVVRGNGFLYKMVRNIVGTFIDFSYKKKTVLDLKKVLFSCDRHQAGPTAPPEGLSLLNVEYDHHLHCLKS